ncbi:hypothetical protein KSP40_PGU014488 [Platanthera guangdongensis]|uniref:Uncharacterized protein n=1 Tax=Platanthera guangdongensis TaxID=2320717 RepID=A0ABR2M9U1_9ASPA
MSQLRQRDMRQDPSLRKAKGTMDSRTVKTIMYLINKEPSCPMDKLSEERWTRIVELMKWMPNLKALFPGSITSILIFFFGINLNA